MPIYSYMDERLVILSRRAKHEGKFDNLRSNARSISRPGISVPNPRILDKRTGG